MTSASVCPGEAQQVLYEVVHTASVAVEARAAEREDSMATT